MIMAKQTDRILVRDKLNIDQYTLEGTITDIKKNLDMVASEATKKGMVGEGYLEMTVTQYYDCGELGIEFRFNRYETDLEYNDRQARLKAQRTKKREEVKKKKEADYQKYLELKAKYEG